MRVRMKGKRRSGAALVELALVIPLFLTLVFGMMEMARLGMVAQQLTGAAREGCRVAVLPGKTASDVSARVNAYLSGVGLPSVTPTVTPSNWTTVSAGTPITVSLSMPYSSVRLFGSVFPQPTNVLASATFSSEKP